MVMSHFLWNRTVILLLVAVLPLFLPIIITNSKLKEIIFARSDQEQSPMAIEICGVKIERNPPQSRLVELGVKAWRTYRSWFLNRQVLTTGGCASKISLAYRIFYLIMFNGKFIYRMARLPLIPNFKFDIVTCDVNRWEGGPSKFPWEFTATETMYLLEGKVKVYVDGHDESFEIGAGDLVVFTNGMKVTWDVTEAVKKHYSLEK